MVKKNAYRQMGKRRTLVSLLSPFVCDVCWDLLAVTLKTTRSQTKARKRNEGKYFNANAFHFQIIK